MYKYYGAKMMIGPTADKPANFGTDSNNYRPVFYLDTDLTTLSWWDGNAWLVVLESGVLARSDLLQEDSVLFGIPLERLRTGAGIVHTATPAANVFGIDVTANVQILKSEAADSNTKTSIATFQ